MHRVKQIGPTHPAQDCLPNRHLPTGPEQQRRRQLLETMVAGVLLGVIAPKTRAFLPLFLRLLFGAGVRGAAARGGLGALAARSGAARAAATGARASGGLSSRAFRLLDNALVAHDITTLFAQPAFAEVGAHGSLEVNILGRNDTATPMGGDLVRLALVDEEFLLSESGGQYLPSTYAGLTSMPPNSSWRRTHQVQLNGLSAGRYLVIPQCINPQTQAINDRILFEPDHYVIDIG